MRRVLACAFGALTLIAAPAHAQDAARPQKTFLTRRDLAWTGAAVVGTVALSHFDVRIANWWQQPSVQGDSSRSDLIHSFTTVNETPLTLAAVALYGVGRLTHSGTVTDVGAHLSEALILTTLTAEAIRGPLGRARPRVSVDDQYHFDFGGGFTKFEDRAFPSIHSAVGFATASVLVGELRERHSRAVWVAAPLLYGAAVIPGVTRMYLNQHWASDIVAGAFLGTLVGSRIVAYGHSHHTTIDRWLIGSTITPMSSQRVALSTTIRF